MQMKKIAAAALAVTLGFGSLSNLAFAQPRGDRDDRGGPPGQQWDRGGPGRGGPDRGGPNRGGPGGRDFGRDHARDMHDRRDMRGAGPDHSFHRGDRLPPQYRSRQYVVNDWRGHRLNAPPRGYQWVQVGGDYVLAAIATGLIATLILNQ